VLHYGDDGRRLNKEIQKLRIRSAKLVNQKNFLIQCRNNRVYPKGLTVKIPKYENDPRIAAKLNVVRESMLKKNLQEVRSQIYSVSQRIGFVENEMCHLFSEIDFNHCQRITNLMREKIFIEVRERQKRKFRQLLHEKREKQRQEEVRQHNRIDTRGVIKFEVKNLTNEGIDADILSYLRLGPNFALTPKALPLEHIVVET
jgi:hypothetical protein